MKQDLFEKNYIKLITPKKDQHEVDTVWRAGEIYWKNCTITSNSTLQR